MLFNCSVLHVLALVALVSGCLKPLYFQDVTVLHVRTPVPSQSKALYRTTQNQFGPMKDGNCCLLGLL